MIQKRDDMKKSFLLSFRDFQKTLRSKGVAQSIMLN